MTHTIHKYSWILLLAVLAPCVSHGQSTIGYNAGVGLRNVTYSGAPVPNGNEVQLGYFTPGFDVPANVGNIFSLASAWHELDSTTITTIFGQPGRFSKTTSTTDPNFDAQKICFWIFKTSDNLAPTGNYGNVQGYGLFSSSLANWLFPLQTAVPPNNMTSV